MINLNYKASKQLFSLWSIRLDRQIKFALLLLIILTVAVPTISWAQDKDEEAIKGVIHNSLKASQTRDGETWQKLWVHDAKASRTRFINSSYETVTGWDNFGPQALAFFKANKEPDQTVVKLDSFIIRKDAKMAFVEYTALSTFNDNGQSVSMPTQEYRVLIKENNQWKLASAITHSTTDLDATPQAMENNLNELGYKYIRAQKLNEAIEILKLNVKLYPNAWNPYDSLGEAYALAGNKDLAMQNYQKSLNLNPKNQNGITALKKLKGE